MSTFSLGRRALAALCTAVLVSGAIATAAGASPTPIDTKRKVDTKACRTTSDVTVLAFNDFHGRLATSSPDTAVWAATLEDLRAQAGANSIVISSGDNVGATLFPSQIAGDVPTINMLNSLQIDSATVGNHELDKGWSDFTDRVSKLAQFPYLASNLYVKGTKTPAVKPYTIVERAGLRIAIVGAITGDLKSLVSPSVFDSVDLGDPVAAVNKYTAQLLDGKEKNGEADVVLASYHEGSPVGTPATLADGVKASPAFADIVNTTDARVAAIFNGHTHMTYAWDAPLPGSTNTRPVIESGSYGSAIGDVTLRLDTSGKKKYDGTVCGYSAKNVTPAALKEPARSAYIDQFPRAVLVNNIVQGALASAAVLGSQVIAQASAPISRGIISGTTTDNRAVESTMSKLVAQMFYDTLSTGDKNFIGIQNPGGSRADFTTAGDITYGQAAAVLPFANTLQTTQITGAQFKTVLEQQWQTNADGTIPARPYLQLALSKNVTYTYDESQPVGSRITSISINGAPIDPAKVYTVGSGNFLIAGGDNFRELAKGVNTRDTGKSDLDSWVAWLKAQGTVKPDFAKQAVSVAPTPTTLTTGQAITLAVGVPAGLQKDTLNVLSLGAPANTSLVATINGVTVGTATVSAGQATITITVPAGTATGAATLLLTAPDTGTVVTIPVTIA